MYGLHLQKPQFLKGKILKNSDIKDGVDCVDVNSDSKRRTGEVKNSFDNFKFELLVGFLEN